MISLIFAAATALAMKPPSCSLFSPSKPLEVRMVFGYKDARPARFVGDRHERIAFIEKLTAPCQGENLACGFARDDHDADSFTKSVLYRGRLQPVHVVVVNSSVGSDDEENRIDAYQVWKSQHAEDVFMEGLRKADVVLYNGHSRFGGGPDFASPLLRKDGTVDPAAYVAEKTNFKEMLSSLKGGHLKLLGLYSCTSTQHFETGIEQASRARFVSSHALMYYSDAMKDSLTTLDEILNGHCTRSF